MPVAGGSPSAVLADQVKSLAGRKRPSRRKGAISAAGLADVRAKNSSADRLHLPPVANQCANVPKAGKLQRVGLFSIWRKVKVVGARAGTVSPLFSVA